MKLRVFGWLVLVAGVAIAIWGKQTYEGAAQAANPQQALSQGETAGTLGGVAVIVGLGLIVFGAPRRKKDQSELEG